MSMNENIVSSLVRQHKQLKDAEFYRTKKRRELEDAAEEFAHARREVVDLQLRVRKAENSIKAVWGKEALEIAQKAVKEDQEKVKE